MIPRFEAESLGFTHALKEFQRLSGRSMRELLHEEFRLGMQTLQKFTPPRSLKQGRARVNADISKVVRGFNVNSFRNERLKEICGAKDFEAWNAFMENVPKFRGAKAVPWHYHMHERARDNRGRVRRRQAANRWVIGDDAATLKAYRKDKEDNVGIARAGWTPALLAAGGRAPAKWIRRHGESGGGYRIENRNTDRETLEAINRTPWASHKEEGQRQINRMLTQREKSIERKTEILRQAGRQAGFEVR